MKKLFALLFVLSVLASCRSMESRLAHFWDGYDFSSVQSIEDIEAVKVKFADYSGLLLKADRAVAAREITSFMEKVSANEEVYLLYYELSKSAFFHMNSPCHSDALAAYFAYDALAGCFLDDTQREEAGAIVRLASVNVPGTEATDGTVTAPDGSEYYIRDLFAKASKGTIVVTADPSCRSCLEMMKQIREDPAAEGMLLVFLAGKAMTPAIESVARLNPAWQVYSAGMDITENYDFLRSPLYYVVGNDCRLIAGPAAEIPRKLADIRPNRSVSR